MSQAPTAFPWDTGRVEPRPGEAGGGGASLTCPRFAVFGMVPFLTSVLSTMLPMLGMAKHDTMRAAFCCGKMGSLRAGEVSGEGAGSCLPTPGPLWRVMSPWATGGGQALTGDCRGVGRDSASASGCPCLLLAAGRDPLYPTVRFPEAWTLVAVQEETSPEPQRLPIFLPAQCWASRKGVITILPPVSAALCVPGQGMAPWQALGGKGGIPVGRGAEAPETRGVTGGWAFLSSQCTALIFRLPQECCQLWY